MSSLAKAFLKRHLPEGARRDLRTIQGGLASLLGHARLGALSRRGLARVRGTGLLLNLGSGPLHNEGWLNVDDVLYPGGYYHDCRNPLPLADGTVRHVHCEHFLEHLEQPAAAALLRECWRVLEPGGSIRIIVPDGEKHRRAFLRRRLPLPRRRPRRVAGAREPVRQRLEELRKTRGISVADAGGWIRYILAVLGYGRGAQADMTVIVDYGVGNLGSIANMFRHIGREARISRSLVEIEAATKLVLPGVGAFDKAMEALVERRGLIEVLDRKAMRERVPLLGICLGMQLLTQGSEEGSRPGLGWLAGTVRRFRFEETASLQVPHMGWNEVVVRHEHPLMANAGAEPRFYFAHSYFVDALPGEDVIGTTTYGRDFPSVIGRGNIMGVQFHPEKSHRFGMLLLKNFSDAP